MKEIEWLCRVPLSIKEAKTLVSSLERTELKNSKNPGYSYQEVKSNYAGVEQRWLVVESQLRKTSDLEKLEKKIKQEEKKAARELQKLQKKEFLSKSEASSAINQLEQELKYHLITEIHINSVVAIPGKSSKRKNENKVENTYSLTGFVERSSPKIEAFQRRAGRFVLATNRLDCSSFTSENMLTKYKEQQSAERGFRFLKDPLFFADSVFLKSPERIETMAMLMGLCLLVYSIGQRQVRLQLKSSQTGLKNQLGKLSDPAGIRYAARPTLRWIFQCFQGIHLVFYKGVKQVVNLTEERLNTLSFFPKACQKYYILSG